MRIIIVSVILALTGGYAHANTEFDMVAPGCVPGDPAVANNRYTIASGAIIHTLSNIDVITMYCPITTPITSPTTLELEYSSSEDLATNYVKAQYIKMSLSTGSLTTLATVYSSNGANNGSVQVVDATISDTFDFNSYVYYVRVDLQRYDTTQTVAFYRATVK